RPKEVGEWFKDKRQLDRPPIITNVAKFAKSWRVWWRAMQPAWRRGDNWPFQRRVVDEEQWVDLRKGGRNGLVMVLITIIWWT
ncbi:hypothetical protein FA95DRAFT_1478205, partial [Auriscalpium vulgare]